MKRVAVFALSCVALALLSGCKGRTMENMQPTDDTVEVVIETTPELLPALDSDSIVLQ